MKKIFIFSILIILSFSIYAQTKPPWNLNVPLSAEEYLRENLGNEEQKRINKLKESLVFGTVEDKKWFDGTFYQILEYFDTFYLYFYKQVKIIASICLVLSIGISAVKMMLSGDKVKETLVSLFISIVIYMIMLGIYPSIMKNILQVTTAFGYSASIYTPFKNKYRDAEDDQKFKNYMINIAAPDMVKAKFYRTPDGKWHEWNSTGQGMWEEQMKNMLLGVGLGAAGIGSTVMTGGTSAPISAVVTASGGAMIGNSVTNMVTNFKREEIPNPDVLNSMFRAGEAEVADIMMLKVIDEQTRLLSFNQVGKTILITLKAIWGNLSIEMGWANVIGALSHLIFAVFVSLMYMWTMIMAVVNYIGSIIEFGFLYSVGILFIPMMLWEGSKQQFKAVVGGMFNITVHLLVKTLVIFLCLFVNIKILRNCFELANFQYSTNKGSPTFLGRLEFYFSVFFLTLIIKMITDQSSTIAGFLCGGSPKLSFGEFAQAAASAGAAGMVAAGAGKAIAGGAAKTGMAFAGGAGNVLNGAMGAAKTVKADGGKLGAQMGAFAKSAGIGGLKSLVGGAASMADKGIDMIAKAPSKVDNLGRMMRYGVHPAAPLSAEGIGIAPRMGRGRGSGGGGSGGNSGKSAEQLLQSNNAFDRLDGYKQRVQDYRASGGKDGEYSGFGGRFKSMSDAFTGKDYKRENARTGKMETVHDKGYEEVQSEKNEGAF
jgi:type IV secretion system protein TrbL